jgi:hypothetical protein
MSQNALLEKQRMPDPSPAAPVPLQDLPAKAKKRRRILPPPVPAIRTLSVGVGIQALDATRLNGSQRLGIIGLPGTGKSTCCKSLLSDLRYNFPVINVFSGSEGENAFYGAVIPKLFVQNRITQKGLKMFVNRQRLAIGCDSPLKDALLILWFSRGWPTRDPQENNWTTVSKPPRFWTTPGGVLSHCHPGSTAPVGSTIRILFKQGRHLRASVWVVQQYVVDLKPS